MPAGGMLIGHHGFFGNSATILFAATSGLLHSAAVGAAVIGPNFAVPKIAQIPGGAIATLAGGANNPSRGAFDRLKKYRGNAMKQRGQAWKAGSLYDDKGIRGRINNIGRRASVGPKGFSPFHKGQAANLMALQQSVDAQAAANDPRMKEFANFDDGNAVLGLSGGTVEGAERAAKVLFTKDGVYDAVRAQAALDGAKGMGINRANAGGAFKTMAQNKSRAVGAGRNDIIEMGAAALAGGNQSMYQSMMFDAAYNSRNAGRNDLGGTANTVTDEAVQKLMTDSGGSINAHDARKYLTTMDGMARTTVPQMMNGHTNQAIADTETIKKMVRSGGKSKQKTIALQRANEIAKNLSQANGDSQDTFNQFFKDLGVDTSSTVSFSRQLAASSLKHNMVDIENRMVEDPRYPNSGRKVYAAADQAAVADIDKLANEIEAGSRTYGNENAYRQQNQYELAA